MSVSYVTDTIKYIGVNDHKIDLFESQYKVPNGVSYNSYIIEDNKITIMDCVDLCMVDEWLENIQQVLGNQLPEYLVCLHMEPDHAGSMLRLIEKYPDIKVVGNAKTFVIMKQFFEVELGERQIVVKEGDTLDLGTHQLQFMMAPMVHWPEVMVAYETTEKVLFSADAFGKFGALDVEEEWACEARRYYFNIVGKYGAQVQALLKKVSALAVEVICPLHGPVLKEDLAYYIGKYDLWSRYEAEDKGVFIAYASFHGNTKEAALRFQSLLEEMGELKISVADLSRCDMAEAIEDAFRYDRLVIAAPTYDGGACPCMEDFLHHLQSKNYQKRMIGIIENGSWAPTAAKKMKSLVEGMKDITLCDTVVTIKSCMNDVSEEAMKNLAKELV